MAAVGCGVGTRIQLAPVLDGRGEVATSVFLVGDAGAARPGDRVLAELVRQAKLAPPRSTVVFLGDNVYPGGVPRTRQLTIRRRGADCWPRRRWPISQGFG